MARFRTPAPGVTATRNGVGNYTVSHAGFFQLPTPIPIITPTGNATVTSIQFGGGNFTVQLSGDANFACAVVAGPALAGRGDVTADC